MSGSQGAQRMVGIFEIVEAHENYHVEDMPRGAYYKNDVAMCTCEPVASETRERVLRERSRTRASLVLRLP